MLKALVLISILTVSACASYTEETREMRSSFSGGSYQAALEKIDKSEILHAPRNRLLLRFEKAMAMDRLGELAKSRSLLLEADKIADELYTVSISKTAATFLYNDSASDYEGEDYEKVAIHTMLALSFLESRQLDEARVEARKINSKLKEINDQYDADNRNRYSEDAFARYLAGTIYEARNEWDNAIIDYARALELYEKNYKEFVEDGPPKDLVIALWNLYTLRRRSDRLGPLEKKYPSLTAEAKKRSGKYEDLAQVVIIHEIDRITQKEAVEFALPISGQVVRFSFPVIPQRPHFVSTTGFSLGQNGKFYRGENVQDMDTIARATLEDKRGRMIVKTGSRLLVKGALTDQAYKNFGLLGGIAANVYSAVTETADTRSWTLLPRNFYLTRAWLEPGAHDVHIKSDGRVTAIKKVHLNRGEVVFLRSRV